MYKVLLADDEILDLRGLQTFMPWHELNMEVVAAVNSGFAALDFIRRNAVDILVTDIRMPNMSGLELARKAVEILPQLKMIFVSGYEDFHYAKQALDLHAKSYVLKPVEEEELILALRSIEAELDREAELVKIETNYKQTIPVIKNELLLRMLQGNHNQDIMATLEREYGVLLTQAVIRVIMIEIDDLAWKLNALTEQEQNMLLLAVYDTLASECEAQGIYTLCKVSKHRLAFMLEQGSSNEITLLTQFIGLIKSKFPLTITVGLGNPVTGVDTISASYQQAKQALENKMVSGKNKIIPFSELQVDDVREIKDLEMTLDSLFTAMSNYQLVQIHDELDVLFHWIKNMKSKTTVYNVSIQIISELDAYLSTLHEDLFKILDVRSANLDILFKFETIDDIQSWLRARVFEISEMLQLKKMKKNNKLIDSICAYVENHVDGNLTLRDVGNYFSFSPNYLGVLFKEGTGVNFSDYVIDRRMERARKLLQEPNTKIFEIADRLGYRSLTYFSRQFKDKYGMTPGEYRKKS